MGRGRKARLQGVLPLGGVCPQKDGWVQRGPEPSPSHPGALRAGLPFLAAIPGVFSPQEKLGVAAGTQQAVWAPGKFRGSELSPARSPLRPHDGPTSPSAGSARPRVTAPLPDCFFRAPFTPPWGPQTPGLVT